MDVYRGIVRAKRNPLDLALYILLFPQLIAGPIVRYNEISNEIDTKNRGLCFNNIAEGIRIFIIGLGKKLLIADICSVPADKIFALQPTQLNFQLAWFGIICYSLQIYFDFAGYSDMAIGLARMFNFHFPMNFNYPYVAQSITEFWRRWHMSLSRWFRDYLYIPLGGNRISPMRTWINLYIVFILCGFWHGASWNFVFWGLYHGSFLALERFGLERVLRNLSPVFRHIYLLIVVMVGWAFFRAESLRSALLYIKAMAGLTNGNEFPLALYYDKDTLLALVAGILGSTPFLPKLADWLRRWHGRRFFKFAYYVGLAVILLLAMMTMAEGTYSPFIYFRF